MILAMDGEDKSGVQNDPLLNNNSESQEQSDNNLTRSSSTVSNCKRHDFLFKVWTSVRIRISITKWFKVYIDIMWNRISFIIFYLLGCDARKQRKWKDVPLETVYG